MAHPKLKLTNKEIVNEVQRLLGVNTTNFTATKQSRLLLRFLNETIAELADYGEWQELYAETTVLASASVEQYEIDPGEPLHHIYEIRFDTDVAPLQQRDIHDLRRLQQTRGHGRPRQFAIVGVDASSGNPDIRLFPIPNSTNDGKPIKVAYYSQPVLVTATATGATQVFPANVLIMGTYAKALLEENGGEPTNEYQVAFQQYARIRNEAVNRFTSDTGHEVYFQPHARTR